MNGLRTLYMRPSTTISRCKLSHAGGGFRPGAFASLNFSTCSNSGKSINLQQYAISGNKSHRRKRIIVAITGATGAPLATHLLRELRQLGVETHVILSTWGLATMKYELDAPNNTAAYVQSLADYYYPAKDVSAAISSAAIRIGYDNDLITRAAGVILKERRRLVLAVRETPLSSIHLENMLEVTRAGAVVFPPMMTFYTRPKGVQDMIEQSVRRMIDMLDLDLEEHNSSEGRWEGFDWKQKKLEEKTKQEAGDTQNEAK